MGSLSLTSREQRHLLQVQELLLSPFNYADADNWRMAVNRASRDLLDADLATFLLRLPAHELLLSAELPDGPIQGYDEAVMPFVKRLRVHEKSNELQVANRPMLWGDHYEEMRRSAYYNEFIVHFRAYDALFASVGEGNQVHGQLLLHHQRPKGPRFGQRGLDLLRLLFPAFAAGVRTVRRFHEQRNSLGRILDRLGMGVALLDRQARVVHANPTARRILENPLVGADAMLCLGQAARPLSVEAGKDFLIDPGDASTEGAFHVSVTRADPSLGLPDGLMALFEPIRDSDEHLREKASELGLTPRETGVALLLARRRTNEEIARELNISPHTARHHTERVLLKLGVRSRRDVAAALKGNTDARDP